jgi:hypothetical protein
MCPDTTVEDVDGHTAAFMLLCKELTQRWSESLHHNLWIKVKS